LLLAGCVGGRERAMLRYDETGVASWYGQAFAGRPTASGERFDPRAMTAAHRTLPLGTLVEVTVAATGRAAVVRVNDRGPGRRERIIDLSQGAARLLRIERDPVRVRVRAVPAGTRPGLVREGRQGS
jgi:rare lipoprotein A